jgi:hypothetical protein
MIRTLNKSLATVLLCGAVGLAGSAFAQAGGAAGGGAAGNPAAAGSTGPGAIGGTAGSINANSGATTSGIGNAGSEIGPGNTNANGAGTTHTGPGQIDTPKSANANTSSKTTSGTDSTLASNASQTDKPDFLGNVQSKSTPARGLKGAAMKRVDTNERRITAELNRASASSTGNANASNQASISTGSNQTIQ